MKNRYKNLIIGYFVLVIILSGCANQVTPLQPTQTVPPPTRIPTQLPPTEAPTITPPIQTPTLPPVCQSLETQVANSGLPADEVVSGMVERLNVGDVTGAIAYFSEDIHGYIIGFPPEVYEENLGKEAFCRTWVNYVNDNLEWEMSVVTSTNTESGTTIAADSRIWLDSYRQMNAFPIEFYDYFHVKDGRIVEYSRKLKPESLAKLREALPNDYFLRSKPGPGISSTTPGSEFNIVFSDLSCTYDGPAVWKSGFLNVGVEVKDDHEYALVFVYLKKDNDIFDIAVSGNVHTLPEARKSQYEFFPGDSTTIQHLVGGDRMFLLCFTKKATEGPVGMFGPFEVRKE